MACNTYIGKVVGDSIGQTKEVDMVEGEIEWREYMWVRVKLKTTKPLIRKKQLVSVIYNQCGLISYMRD